MIKISLLALSIACIGYGLLAPHHTSTTVGVGMLGGMLMIGLFYLQAAANDWTLSQIGLYREGDQIKSKATCREITFDDVAMIDDRARTAK